MRKIILSLFLLTQTLCNAQGTDELVFRVMHKPETKYSQFTLQTSHSEITYMGSKEFLQKLNEKGIKNPTLTNKESTMESILRTGKRTKGANFPLTIEVVKTTSSDGKKSIPDGTMIYGKAETGRMPTLDSVVSDELDSEVKKILLQTMQSTFSQLSFPEKRVKPGDSFSIESPISIPIAGITIDMTITTHYKLLSVTNGIAQFDVSQVYTMTSTITKYSVTATGNGMGKLFYDVSNNFYNKFQMDTEMVMTMKLDNFDMSLNSKSGLIQTTTISKN